MGAVHLDTHVVARLFLRLDNRIERRARTLIARSSRLVISPLVLIELDDLIAAGRIKVPSAEFIIDELSERIEPLTISETRLIDIVAEARGIGWTRDPMDRLIVAGAIADRAKLVTADEKIRANFKDAVWD